MKIKRYDRYIAEESEWDDEYPYDDAQEEDEDEEEDDDVAQHLLYLLRSYLSKAGIKNADVRGNADVIKMEITMSKKENMAAVISTFATLRKISEEILPDYDCEFDIWKNKKGEPLLILDFYSEDAMSDDVF